MDPKLKILFWSSAVILISFYAHFSSGLELAENGGYKILIAVEEDAEVPENIPDYIRKIEGALRSFAQILFMSTDTFHLASVELLLPRSWPTDTPGVGEASGAHTLASSDIRLSRAGTFPYVENPNACGLPGQYIQLPVDFFQPGNTMDGKFGSPAKAFLTQWARYRWGVWEEHGYPEDSKFPYFYPGETDESWLANSCSNDEVHGDFTNIVTDDTCDQNQADALDENCRFKPHTTGVNNHVSSSLMSYPWLESVVRFCDATTHNKAAPNRQNVFCNYLSAMEVIEQTPDYAAVTVPEDFSVPSLTFKTVQHKAAPEAAKPALFILLDKGNREPQGTAALSLLMPHLASMLLGDLPEGTVPLPEDVVVSGGVFPDANAVMSTSLAWAPLEESRKEELWDFFATAADAGESYNRNFIEAISQVIRTIEILSPENGAMILVIKTGAPGNSYFEKSTLHEVEIETALKQNNIKLFAVEVTDMKPGSVSTHLHGLATRTSGAHSYLVDITDLENPEKAAEIVALGIEEALAVTVSPQKILVAHKGSIALSTTEPAPQEVRLTGRSRVKVTLVTPYNLAAQLELDGLPAGVNNPGPVSRDSNEWGVESRQNHFFEFDYNSDEPTTISVRYTCAEVGACATDEAAFLYVTETFTGEDVPDVAKVKVTVASRPETRIEFTPTTAPYAVSAKVEYDGRPVTNARVTATAKYGDPETEVVFELLDNGNGYPDGAQFDGIYSAHFVPPADGTYYIKVDVTRNEVVPPRASSSIPRLLPIDQNEFGCVGSCDATELPATGDLEIKEIQLPAVEFLNVEAYPRRGHPDNVVDFEVKRNAARTGVNFNFTSPGLIGSSGVKASRYVIYAARTKAALLPVPPPATELRTFTVIQNPGEQELLGEPVIPDIELIHFGIVAYAADGKASQVFISRIDIKAEEADFTTPDGGDPDSPTPPPSPTPSPSPPPTPSSQAPTSSEEPDDDSTPFFESPGGIAVIILIVILVLGGAGGGFWYWRKKEQNRGRGYSSA